MTSRTLTTSEINLAKIIFKNSIEYQKVKIHDHKYAFFQPLNSGMTPNGEIYIDGAYLTDFSTGVVAEKSFFIHEMVHVWQFQNDILNPILSAIGNSFVSGFDYNKAYEYTLELTKDLLDYRMEQQAAIIEDHFRIFHEHTQPVSGRMQNAASQGQRDRLLKSVLAKFLKDPKYPTK